MLNSANASKNNLKKIFSFSGSLTVQKNEPDQNKEGSKARVETSTWKLKRPFFAHSPISASNKILLLFWRRREKREGEGCVKFNLSQHFFVCQHFMQIWGKLLSSSEKLNVRLLYDSWHALLFFPPAAKFKGFLSSVPRIH